MLFAVSFVKVKYVHTDTSNHSNVIVQNIDMETLEGKTATTTTHVYKKLVKAEKAHVCAVLFLSSVPLRGSERVNFLQKA